MSDTNNLPLPDQQEGAEKNIESTIETASDKEAAALFQYARTRLLDVNKWQQWAGKLSAKFELMDSKGNPVESPVKVGHYFKIDIPGPGSSAGEGYDWVKVEEITEDANKAEDTEYILIRVRPSDNPSTSEENVAHFFSEKSTSNFVVKRDKKIVTTAVYGRNEVPNTATGNSLDKVRNAVIGISAVAGVSNAQWKSLVEGLLKKD
jgi:hypothetical protein